MHVAAAPQKVLTVSRKSERLVNLTIALLATKRYLTKSEIFRTVEGYEGSAESMERMFERDKDDLRGLGIVIELGTFDPLFEDEAGYRITPASYQLAIGELDGTDIALLSIAATSWSGAALERESTSALVKLESMGIESNSEALSLLAPRVSTRDENFVLITDAIVRRATIAFEYVGSDLSLQQRTIYPFSLRGQSGIWYLRGLDSEKNSLRTFRLDRISSAVKVSKKSGTFEIPNNFPENSENVPDSARVALIRVRKNRGRALRSIGRPVVVGEEWDELEIPILNTSWLLGTVLWHRNDVVVLEPSDFRSLVIESLREVVELHG